MRLYRHTHAQTKLTCWGRAARGTRLEPNLCGDSQRERLMIRGANPCNLFVFNTKTAKDDSVFQ
jgi:hypothetical protein